MAAIQILFVLGLVFFLCVMVSSQHLSYGEKITALSKLTDSVERSRLFSSPKNYEIVDAVDDVLRNWDRTLLRLAQNNRWAASGEVSHTCISHLNLTLAHITETWALRSKYTCLELLENVSSGIC